MNAETKIRFRPVTHKGPDIDATNVVERWLAHTGKTLNDSLIATPAFVEAGGRYVPKDEDTALPIHFDCGDGQYDHHQLDSNFLSALDAFCHWHPEVLDDPLTVAQLKATNRADSPKHFTLDTKLLQAKDEVNSRLTKINEGLKEKLVVAFEKVGPWEVNSLIFTMQVLNDELDDLDNLKAGIAGLRAWRSRETYGLPTINDEIVRKFDHLIATYLYLCFEDRWIYDTQKEALRDIYEQTDPSGNGLMSTALMRMFPSLSNDYYYRQMVGLVEQLARTHDTYINDPASRTVMAEIEEELAIHNSGSDDELVVIPFRNGPYEIFELFCMMDETDDDQLRAGLVLLNAWFNKRTYRFRFNKFIDANPIKKIEHPTLNLQLIPPTKFTTKILRSCLKIGNKTEAYVSQHHYPRSEKTEIGITRLSRYVVGGMAELATALRQLADDPEEDVFIHKSEFVIYAKQGGKITVEKVIELAQKHLFSKRHGDAPPTTEEDAEIMEIR